MPVLDGPMCMTRFGLSTRLDDNVGDSTAAAAAVIICGCFLFDPIFVIINILGISQHHWNCPYHYQEILSFYR